MSILTALFGTGAWGTGGNLVAAAILSGAAWLARGPLGRRLGPWIARHLAPHLAPHVAAHVADHLREQPTGYLTAPQELTEQQVAELSAAWNQAHFGPARRRSDPPPAAASTAAVPEPAPAPRRPPPPAPPRPKPAAPTTEGTQP